ncbi:MAG TPA: DUF5946 family protein [Thermoanaerobaculia bacterium]|nr:DUF5946 family protein [Thermoanaerobaculia bacterium]
MTTEESACPGCGLHMPRRPSLTAHGYYNASPECWSVYTEVLGAEYSNAVLFGQVHQLTVDTYAVQHAGGEHPDKSVDVHLAGLHLVLVRGISPPEVPPYLQRLAGAVSEWPHFDPPRMQWATTVLEVALAGDAHAAAARKWSGEVWQAWSAHHGRLAAWLEAKVQ